jgi:phospholipid/cholesterol/gamma-HCH transport system substrate-binding protein
MNKQRPSNLAVLTMVAFTASCVGLLIFLWISFGGTLPFNAQGYRFSVEFNQATELASNAEVEIAGVTVGHVTSVGLDHQNGLTRAVIQIDHQYVPRPADTQAILRQKSLLGETYVQLSAGNPHGRKLPDGATLPRGQVASTVQLDQILNTFDPKTRAAFQTWMQQGGIALTNRGQQFNAAFAELYPFATNVNSVLAVLHRQQSATTTLLHDGGQVFSALSSSPAELQGFVRNTNQLFATTASRDAALAATIRAFPAFLTQTRVTTDKLGAFAANTKPLIDELHPAAAQLNPAVESVASLAPELQTLLTNLRPLTDAGTAGLPALGSFLNRGVPFLAALKPFLGNLDPVINYLNVYRRELAGFFANGTASSQAVSTGVVSGSKVVHYVRLSVPISPEAVATYQTTPYSNRINPYLKPGGYSGLLSGLPVFGSYLCTDNPLPSVSPTLTTATTIGPLVLTQQQLVQQYYFTSDPSGPACKDQGSLGTVTTGQTQSFPHLQPRP